MSHGNHDLLPTPTPLKAGRKELRELSNLLLAAPLMNLKQKPDVTAGPWLRSIEVAGWGGERQSRYESRSQKTNTGTVWGSGTQSHVYLVSVLRLELRRDIFCRFQWGVITSWVVSEAIGEMM